MTISRRTALIATTAMIGTAAASAMRVPVADPTRNFDLEQAFPARFADWFIDTSMIPVPPSPDIKVEIDRVYQQVLTRTYANAAGQRIMLVVAYGGDQSESLRAHRQEVCYSAQGFTIQDVRPDVLAVGAAHVPLIRLHAVKGARSEPVSYWFTMGNRVVVSRLDRLATQLEEGLSGRLPDGLLFRVSSVSPDKLQGWSTQDTFVRSLIANLSPDVRIRVSGIGAGDKPSS